MIGMGRAGINLLNQLNQLAAMLTEDMQEAERPRPTQWSELILIKFGPITTPGRGEGREGGGEGVGEHLPQLQRHTTHSQCASKPLGTPTPEDLGGSGGEGQG